ncbi:MAG: hypothetical protein GY758_29015 [Fuerstiella sp.]|jgi:hypothetical protein|nr:hypothetical protein [Fuerstiella sp.]MCP4509645.1 hypothetical protein [Fuerstiella sp.]MDG2129450.1 hypothetical protein [Fuerstiella sp.]
MILIPIFLALFAGWMLWGWTVGESRNVKWLRCCCAPVFVMTVMVISAGAGAKISRVIIRNSVREDIAKLLTAIEMQLQTGSADKVITEIRALNHSDDPDADAFDMLDDVAQMTANLSRESRAVAEGPRPLEMH